MRFLWLARRQSRKLLTSSAASLPVQTLTDLSLPLTTAFIYKRNRLSESDKIDGIKNKNAFINRRFVGHTRAALRRWRLQYGVGADPAQL